MDFSNRGEQFNPTATPHESNDSDSNKSPAPRVQTISPNRLAKGDWSHNKPYRIVQSVLALCVLVVVIGLLFFLVLGNPTNSSEDNYVQTSKLQAVFLNTGQVYFGNIKRLNNQYLVLTNIFYLQTASNSSSSSSSSSNQSVSLVKLGCEIHAPLDQMIINRASMTFWENLSPSGQVSKAVASWEKSNPNGQKCSNQSNAGSVSQSSPQSSINGSSTTSTTPNSTSTSTGTK